jgi:Family of unknown function (DUF6262)
MPREDGKDIRIAALKTAAVAKQLRAAEGLEKAIDKLIKTNEPMSFANVAREAGVSISYLYKYPAVKARVLELRNQQQVGVFCINPPKGGISRFIAQS